MAIERNFTGWQMQDFGEARFGGSGGWVGLSVGASGGRSGSGPCRLITVVATSTSNLFQMPAGSVSGTSGTVSSGNHKRLRARIYFRVDATTFPFGNSAIRIFGTGGELDATSVNVWMDAQQRILVKVGPGLPANSGTGFSGATSGALTTGTWYRLILDIDYAVAATTVVTASVQVTTDVDFYPPIDVTLSDSLNIGASDNLGKMTILSERVRSSFDATGTFSWADWFWVAASDADATVTLTLPSATHVFAIVPPTGVALNQWSGTYSDVDEYPESATDTMTSSGAAGTEVEFSHASGLKLGLSSIQAMKLYVNALVSGAGSGAVDYMLNGVAKSVTLGTQYPAVNGAADPVGGLLYSTLTPAVFSATTFGLKKQNAGEATTLANIGLEVLGIAAAFGFGNQIRGSSQIKAGSIYDAQIADSAAIARHKIQGLSDGLAQPVFFPEEAAEDWMLIPGPPGAAAKAAAQVVPVFFPDDLFEEMPMGAGGGSGSSAIVAAVNASAYRATNQTLTHNVEASLSFSNIDFDTSSIWSAGSPTRMTCPATGVYAVRATVKFGTGFKGTLALRIYKNGALYTEETSAGLDLASGSEYHQVSAALQLVPTDYVEVKALALLIAGSGTIDAVGGSGNTFIQVILQSPQVGTAATPAGALILLESHSAAGGGSASLDFTTRNATNQSGATFQSDYDDYVIEFVNILPATNGASLNMRASTDGGATFDSGANYRYAYQFSNSAAGSGQSSSAAATSVFCAGTFTNTASAGSKGHIELANPLSASQTKLMLLRAAFLANDGNYYHLHGMGGYISTTAVNALRFLMSAGNIAAGTIRIYGMAK